MSGEKKPIAEGKEGVIFENKDKKTVWKVVHNSNSVELMKDQKDQVLAANTNLVNLGVNTPKIYDIRLLFEKAFMLMDKVNIINFRFDRDDINSQSVIEHLNILKQIPYTSWVKLWKDIFAVAESGLHLDLYYWADNINLVKKSDQLEFEIFDNYKIHGDDYAEEVVIVMLYKYFIIPLEYLLMRDDLFTIDQQNEILQITEYTKNSLEFSYKDFRNDNSEFFNTLVTQL